MNTNITTDGKTSTDGVGVTETRKVKRSIIIEFDDYKNTQDFDRLTEAIACLLEKNKVPCGMSSYRGIDRCEHLSPYDNWEVMK